MYTGRSVQQVTEEIQRQIDTKRDWYAPRGRMEFQTNGLLGLEDIGEFPLTQHAHRQLGDYLGIPAKYYDKMKAHDTELLAHNVNTWLSEEEHLHERRMVRTLDGEARAILSDRYRVLDHHDLINSVLPVLNEVSTEVRSCEISATHLYFKAVMHSKTAIIGKNHEVQPGLTISNSEVGAGALAVRPAIHTVGCTNLVAFSDASMKKYHVGVRAMLGDGDDNKVWEYLSDETKQLTNQVIWAQTQDLVRASVSGEMFDNLVAQMDGASKRPIVGNIVEVNKNVAKHYHLNEEEEGSVLGYLAMGGDMSQLGMCNAVTRASQDVKGYERATDLEKIGGKIIELKPGDWEVMGRA